MIWDKSIEGLAVLFAGALLLTPLAAQDVLVTAADPASAPQGTINLNVRVSGKGFKPGAQSHFYVTGTANPGGVKVNSTAYVSPTQLISNIDVADTAILANYDIEVALLSGRTGKGIEKFTVLQKGANTCTLQPLPAGFTLVGTLNGLKSDGTPVYQYAFGVSSRIRKATIGGREVLIAVVGHGRSSVVDVFFLDPLSGQLLDGQVIGSATQAQPHVTLTDTGTGALKLAMGDINGDGAPDIATGHRAGEGANTFLSQLTASGVLQYSNAIPLTLPPDGLSNGGFAVAIGDLDGDGRAEVAVGTTGGGGKGSPTVPGKVYIFQWNGLDMGLIRTVTDPLNGTSGGFGGKSVAFGDVTGDASTDLVVGSANSSVNGVLGAGQVYVFPGPSLSAPLSFNTGGKEDYFGSQVAAADVNGGYADLFATTSYYNGGSFKATLYTGLVSQAQSPSLTLTPIPGLEGGWATDVSAGDINGDGLADILVGAPNAAPATSCPASPGAAYVYLTPINPSNPSASRYLLEAPTLDADFGGYGFSVAAANGSHIFLVGENGRNLGGVTSAGQVYVYRVN